MNRRRETHQLSERGVSLGEVLLVILLMSILAIVIVPRFINMSDSAKWEACATNVANINALVQLFYIKEETWPTTYLSDIRTNTNYFPEATLPTCPVTPEANYYIVSPGHIVSGHQRNVHPHP